MKRQFSSGVVTETMEKLANSLHGYQCMGRCRNSVTKCVNDTKAHTVTNNKVFLRLKRINDQNSEVNLVDFEN